MDSRLLSLFANYVVKGYGYRDVKVDHESAQMWNDIIHTLVQREVYEKLFQPLGRSNANEKLLRLVWGGPLTANESADAVGEELKESTLRRRQETFWAASSAEQKHMWISKHLVLHPSNPTPTKTLQELHAQHNPNVRTVHCILSNFLQVNTKANLPNFLDSKDGILGRGLESEESTASSANQSASNAGTGITQETSPEYEGHSRNPATATFGDQTASDASSQISQETLVDDDDDDSVNAASSANLSHPATNRLIGAENPPPPMYQPTGDANDDGPDVPVQRRSLIKRASTWFETEVTVRAGTEHLIVAPDPSQQVNNGREEYPPYTWGKRGMDRAILIAWPLSDYWRPRPPPRPVVRARRRKAAYKGNLKRLKADHRAERGH